MTDEMREWQAVVAVSHYLQENGYQFFIHSGSYSSGVDDLPTRLKNCGINNTIRIERRTPDIIGYNEDGEIFAVEVKGGGDPRKGIGQAAHYRKGVHRSYLAAPVDDLDEFADTIRSCGVGLLRINDEHDGSDWASHVTKVDPIENLAATQLNKTRRALAIKTSDFEADRNAFSSSTMPLNALLPITSMGMNDSLQSWMPLSDCRDTIVSHEKGIGKSTSAHAFSLARTLQLIEIDRAGSESRVRATDIGRMGHLLLKGRVNAVSQWSFGVDQSQTPDNDHDSIFYYLQKIKYKRQPIYRSDSEIAAFLRYRYLAVPDVRLLTYVLASHDGETAELSHILAEIALESPDVFINLFLESDRQGEFTDLIDESKTNPKDRELRESILNLSSPDYLYNFVRQLTHVHILDGEDNAVHQEEELKMDEYYWNWDTEIIGDLGFRL